MISTKKVEHFSQRKIPSHFPTTTSHSISTPSRFSFTLSHIPSDLRETSSSFPQCGDEKSSLSSLVHWKTQSHWEKGKKRAVNVSFCRFLQVNSAHIRRLFRRFSRSIDFLTKRREIGKIISNFSFVLNTKSFFASTSAAVSVQNGLLIELKEFVQWKRCSLRLQNTSYKNILDTFLVNDWFDLWFGGQVALLSDSFCADVSECVLVCAVWTRHRRRSGKTLVLFKLSAHPENSCCVYSASSPMKWNSHEFSILWIHNSCGAKFAA